MPCADAGLDEATLASVVRPIPAMRVETARGTTFRLTYGDDGSLAAPAVGFDRSALDPALLALRESAGADIRLGERGRRVEPGTGRRPVGPGTESWSKPG